MLHGPISCLLHAQRPIQPFSGHRSDWAAGESVPGGLFRLPGLLGPHHPEVTTEQAFRWNTVSSLAVIWPHAPRFTRAFFCFWYLRETRNTFGDIYLYLLTAVDPHSLNELLISLAADGMVSAKREAVLLVTAVL